MNVKILMETAKNSVGQEIYYDSMRLEYSCNTWRLKHGQQIHKTTSESEMERILGIKMGEITLEDMKRELHK